MSQITIGHDSEFGLTKNNRIISALDVFGSKVYEDENGRAFADNMNCEIAINPVTTLQGFHDKTTNLLQYVTDRGYGQAMLPVIRYDDKYLDHPDARISGCNPDFNAYFMENNNAPDFTDMDGTRSCGAHVHAQLTSGNPYWFTRWMDALVAVPLLKYEDKSTRRSLYGGAGCLRVKPYGAEYRSLSNVWLGDKARREFVWEMTHKAVVLSETTDPASIEMWEDIPTAIDQHDVDLAQRCIDRLYMYGVVSL
tara:strand:+ start:872 stop:1627 length:756 start_codon:yes stop_codon:yes gene_type:complete